MAPRLQGSALHAFKWSALGEAASRLIAPLVMLLLARLLVPEDFGVVAAATVVVSFSQVFTDAGLAKALIQRKEHPKESANAMFWLNVFFGGLAVCILLIVAPAIASFFHDDRIAPVVKVLSLQVLLSACSSTQGALLQKHLGFKQLFWARAAASMTSALVSIPLALQGMGYWALVAGSLVGQAFQSAVQWKLCDWRPSRGLNLRIAAQLLAFGKWAMFSSLLAWFYGWMDAAAVGRFLGSHDLGLYRTGLAVVAMLFGMLTAPLMPVLYSVMCSRPDPRRLPTEGLHAVILCMGIAASSLAFCLILFREMVILVVGSQWAGIEQVIVVLAIVFAMSAFASPTLEAYRAAGKPHVETAALAAIMPTYVVIYLTMNESLDIFLDGRLLAAVLTIGIHWFMGWRFAGLRWTWAAAPLFLVSGLGLSRLLDKGNGIAIDGGLQVAAFAAALAVVLLLNRTTLISFAERLPGSLGARHGA